MSMKRDRYPADWDKISNRIRFVRAKGHCEECGVPHGAIIMRSTTHPERYLELIDGCWYTPGGDLLRASELPMEFDNSKITKVYLTTHHIGVPKPDGSPGSPHDKMDCRDENLIALCERCHWLADMDSNIIARRKTRRNNQRLRRKAAGQLEFWEES